jgi:hypothetical protein
MKFWFWVKMTITAFILFGVAAHYGLSQALQPASLKACRTQYVGTVEQLVLAAVAIEDLNRRQAVIDLAAVAQHSYDLVASDPPHSAAVICAPDRLAKLDAILARLKTDGYIPDPEVAGAAQSKLSGELLADAVARFWAVFPSRSGNPALDRKTINDQKRPTSPRPNPGVLPYP